MKNVFKIMMLSILVFTFSCKNNTTEEVPDGRTNPVNEDLTNTTNYKKNGNFDNKETINITQDTDSINENWNLDDPERQKALYSRFRMDNDQIERYESALEEWLESELENPYDKMSANERIKKEDDIMEKVLNDSQYDQYKQWASDNDER